MKTNLFNHNGSMYWAELKRISQRSYTSSLTHRLSVFREGESSPMAVNEVKGTDPFLSSAKKLIDGHIAFNKKLETYGLEGLLM